MKSPGEPSQRREVERWFWQEIAKGLSSEDAALAVGGMGQWTGQIGAFGLDEQVREAVILTVGAHWDAAFEVYAHVAGARGAGLPEHAIAAIVDGGAPSGLSAHATTGHQLTAALLADHRVADDLYDRAVSAFGEDGVIALLSLIGQYQTISLILVTFEVPTPEGAER